MSIIWCCTARFLKGISHTFQGAVQIILLSKVSGLPVLYLVREVSVMIPDDKRAYRSTKLFPANHSKMMPPVQSEYIDPDLHILTNTDHLQIYVTVNSQRPRLPERLLSFFTGMLCCTFLQC